MLLRAPSSAPAAGKFRLKKICEWASAHGFTHLLVLNERAKEMTG